MFITENRRLQLHEVLCEVLGTRNVYFQPPESVQMTFPAIVYSIDDIDPIHANGGVYLCMKRYSVIVIADDPDTEIVDKISALPLCRFVRPYISDNLNHYVFEIYY